MQLSLIMALRPALLLLCLCGLSMSEDVFSPGPLKLLAGAKLGSNHRNIVPVSNVFVSGLTVNEDFNNTVIENCTADGTSPIFKWFQGSTEIIGDGQRIHVTQGENYGLLTISPIYRFDLASETHCEASNAISKAESFAFAMEISYCPQCVIIYPEAPPYYVASRSDFSLSCSSPTHIATNHTWYLDGTMLNTTGPVLTVKDIEKEGLGRTRSLYNCWATSNSTGEKLVSMPVVFIIIDEISGVELAAPNDTLVAGSSSASLNCSETGGSMPTFTWLKDGFPLNFNDRVVISADKKSVLIKPVQKEDNGEYSCEVSNPVNTVSAKASLTVDAGSGGLSGGAIAGIVIGVLAAVALAVGLFVFWQKKLRH